MLTPEFIDEVVASLARGRAWEPDVATTLRAAYPGYHFAVAFDNDIPSRLRPLAEGDGFNLYGISTSDHCAALTPLQEAASGMLVALVSPDD